MNAPIPERALLDCVEALAADVGRLRRRVSGDPQSSLTHLVDRLAAGVQWLDLLLRPSAAEIAASWAPGDDDAIDEAIRIVDARNRELRGLLGVGRQA